MKRNFIVVVLILGILVTSCANNHQKRMLLSFSGEKAFTPSSPQLFIPGLGFTGKFWSDSKMFQLFKEYGWKYGGDIKTIQTDEGIKIESKDSLIPAHIYSITFSNTQLPIQQQGKEVAKAVEFIKELNQKDTVVLYGHSMGGLAAREYLQSSYYQNDVAAYISIGTPHQGSNFDLDRPLMKLLPHFIQNMYWKVDEEGDAVRDLRTDSIYLNGGKESDSPERFRNKDINLNGNNEDTIIGLNELDKKPLPKNVFYASVIGGGNPAIATRNQSKTSDGIVDIQSQDLNQLPGIDVASYVIISDSNHFGEADDIMTVMQIVRMREFLVLFSKFNVMKYGSGKEVVDITELESN